MPAIDPGTLRIGDLPVFLVGDANGYRALLHEAADEGHIAGRMAAPDTAGVGLCRRTHLFIVFSTPQVARIGPPLSELEDENIATGGTDFSQQSRARMAQTAAGKRLEMDSACSKRLFDETGYKAIAIDDRFIHDFVVFSELGAPLQSTSHGQPFVTGHRPFMTTITA